MDYRDITISENEVIVEDQKNIDLRSKNKELEKPIEPKPLIFD